MNSEPLSESMPRSRKGKACRSSCDRLEQRERHVLADDGGDLQQAFVLWRKTVDARRQHDLDCGRDLDRLDRLGQLIPASLAHEGLRLHGDLRLRILTTTHLEQAYHYQGEYERVVELATENLAALPLDWVSEYLGGTAPASVYDRVWLVMSLAHLGRFAETAEYESEAIRLAEKRHHPFTVAQAHRAAGFVHLLKAIGRRRAC